LAKKALPISKHVTDGSASTNATFREHGGAHVASSDAALCQWHWANTTVGGFEKLQARVKARGDFKYPKLAAAINGGKLTKDHIKRQGEYAQKNCGGSVAEFRRLYV
jgi:hypothetical protein